MTLSGRVPWTLPICVFAVACLQYLSTASFDFAWDDKLVITANAYTTKGVQGLPEIFTKRVSVPYKSEYRPVPQALFAIEYQLSGGSPRVGHALNVLWYGLACVAVYFLVRFALSRTHPLFPFATAVLFAVHPLHTEVVANIKSRDEILALLFGVAAIILLVIMIEKGRVDCGIAGAICFLAAILSKSNAITMLPLAPIVAWFRSESYRLSRKLVVAGTVIAVICVSLGVVARYFQSTTAGDTPLHLNSTVLNNVFLWTTSPKAILPTAVVIIARYLLLFVYAHPLIHLYGYDQIPLSRWTEAGPWLVTIGLGVVAYFIWRTWRERQPWHFGVVWFALTYSVYSNLFFYAPDTMADRYVFIPSVGLAILAVLGFYRLAGIALTAPDFTTHRSKAVASLFVLVIGGYFVRTIMASQDWRSDSTLIHNRIRYMQRNAAAQAIFGHTLLRESTEVADPALKGQRRAEAMRAFMSAIAIYPDFQAVWVAIGKLFAERGMYDKAELAFLKAQRLEPLGPDSYLCLGTLYLARHDTQLAIPYLEKAVLLDPTVEETYVMLGKAYLNAGSVDNLGSMIATARRAFPENLELQALEATYCFRKKQYDKAFELARAVVRKEPQNLLAQTILASPASQEFVR